jgi:hypothetical protein
MSQQFQQLLTRQIYNRLQGDRRKQSLQNSSVLTICIATVVSGPAVGHSGIRIATKLGLFIVQTRLTRMCPCAADLASAAFLAGS